MDGGRTRPHPGLEGGMGIGYGVPDALGAGSIDATQLTCK
jgi:hypothetical protein